MKQISVVTLTHNRIDYTRWCLKGLRETSYRPLEIVFVDNGSTDGTVEVLKEFASSFSDATCKVIENTTNAIHRLAAGRHRQVVRPAKHNRQWEGSDLVNRPADLIEASGI